MSSNNLIPIILSGNDNLLSKIPDDVLYYIALNNLSQQDILRLSETSKYFNQKMSKNEAFWKQLFNRDFTSQVHNFKSLYLLNTRQLIPISSDLVDPSELLYDAARRGYEKLVLSLLNKSDYNFSPNELNRAFLIATQTGNINIMKILLQKGAKVDTENNTAIRQAVIHGFLDVVKFLVANGANIHTDNERPLSLAIQRNNINIIKFLLESGTIVTPGILQLAQSRDNIAILKLLQQYQTNQV